jgi:hypothetical protein
MWIIRRLSGHDGNHPEGAELAASSELWLGSRESLSNIEHGNRVRWACLPVARINPGGLLE